MVVTAIAAPADAIVTFNGSDFAADHLKEHLHIEVIHPDDFVMDLVDLNEKRVVAAFRELRARKTNPPWELPELVQRLSGTVAEVKVRDTEAVTKGEVLVVIDPTDANLAVAQAEADLDRAIRRVKGYVAMDENLAAQIMARREDERRAAAQLAAAKADLDRASVDLHQREALVESGSVSGDELTHARNAYLAAEANLRAADAIAAQARANLRAAMAAKDANSALISDTTVENNPEVRAARARLDQAKVDLQRTVIRAPLNGIIAKRQVQAGQRVQIGMPLIAVVPVNEIYVDANFKEGELAKVRVGQPVELHSDLYGGKVSYAGVVAGFAGGSGSAFAAIPAQNATGNWIKVVQRFPVRIKLNPATLRKKPLRVGLSMTATVDTRGTRD